MNDVSHRRGATLAAPAIHRLTDDTQNLTGLLSILARSAIPIVLATALGTILALGYLMVATPVYTASTSIFIDPRMRKVVPEEIVRENIGSDFALVESQVAIIGSDSVLRRVVKKLSLDQDPEFAPEPSTGLLSTIKAMILKRPSPADPETRAILTLSENMRVKRPQKTYVVEVEVASASPVKAARITEAVVEAYLEDQADNKADEARRANKLLDSRLDELRSKLRQAELRIDEFKKANKILTSEGGLVTEQQLTRLNAELATARAVAAESKARLELVESALKSGSEVELLPDAIRSSLVQKLREQYAQVARREAALSTQLQSRHPVLIEARSQLAEIKSQIAAELKRVSTSARSEHQIAANRVAEIERTLNLAKEEVARTNTAQIRLREFEQEAASSRDLLSTFLARAKQTQEQQNLAVSEARVISPASVPTRPSKPQSWLVLGLGLFGGLGLGLAWALTRDHLDRSVRSGSEVAAATGLATIASIPTLTASGLLGRLIPGRMSGADTAGFADLMAAIAGPGATASGRAYRQAVLRLLSRVRMLDRTHQPQIVLVFGPRSDTGVSATALALAYAAACNGERTLLVDAASADCALSTALSADLRHDGVIVLDNKAHLQAITRRDARSGLAFLPIALADLRALRAHQRKRLATGISGLAQSHDFVVIDGGGLLDDESATALVPIADRIVLVARAGETTP
ncbi:MAG: GumC family protein, partial [Hyphomicrobiaceae bacterium]